MNKTLKYSPDLFVPVLQLKEQIGCAKMSKLINTNKTFTNQNVNFILIQMQCPITLKKRANL